MKHSESKETPKMEAEYHSKGFLKKAAKLADRKLGKGRRSRKVRGKRTAKKGY